MFIKPGKTTERGNGQEDTTRRRALALCLAAVPLLIGSYAGFLLLTANPPGSGTELRLDQFLSEVAGHQVENATILPGDDRITGFAFDTGPFWVDYASGHESMFAALTDALQQAKVPTTVDREPLRALAGPAGIALPGLIIADSVVILTMVVRGRRARAEFGRAAARQASGDGRITFDDLAGVDEAVEELREIRDYLADPKRFVAAGAAIPKGILLSGPPGCGKTRLARAVSGEARAPFFAISGSDFVEMYVGVGAARIRDLFDTARVRAPAIVFIDELDAVGRRRTDSPAGGQDEREATLNQLLVEMDGFDGASGVVVLAATNRPDILDPALLRPGRFDRRISVDLPDVRGRAAILSLHTQGKPIEAEVDLKQIARSTAGFSGADLANVVNEAALLAMRRGAAAIDCRLMSEAIERVVAGPQRRSRILSGAERERIAYHEAGHAVCATALPGADRVGKVSIVARGHGGGFTWFVNDDDAALATRTQLLDRIAALLAGRAAEELRYGEPSTSTSDDLVKAASIARRMVTELGMSDRIGPVAVLQVDPAGTPAGACIGMSERLSDEMDAELQRIVRDGLERATCVLRRNRAVLGDLARQLLACETLEGPSLQFALRRVKPGSQASSRRRQTARPAAQLVAVVHAS